MSIGIVLKTINNEVFNLNVPIDLPIPELKQMVRQSTSIPEDRQRLIYRGHVLQDQSVLNDYKVEDGHTIHMVARPPDYEDLRNQISRREEQNSTTTSVRDSLHSLFALSSLIGDSNNNSNASRTGLGGSRNGNDSNLTPELPTSLEPIRQSLLTTHTLLSTINCDHGGPNLQNPSIRKYFVGQWLDVKDTVNQWLEATVMQVDLEQCRIFVHYNGWPTRWDEWIVFSSPRLAPFRTRTANTTLSSSCPAPTNTVAHAPLTGRDDIRTIIPEINRLMMTIQPLLNAATLLCDESLRLEVPTESTTPSYAEGMPWDELLNERDNIGKTSGLSETMDSRPTSSSDQELDMKLKDAITDICPLLDRLGRVFTDLSPQIHRYCQPATTTTTPSSTSTSSASASQSTASNSPTNRIGGTQSLRQGLYPYGALHNRQMRPPSPPPESFFRVPVTNPPRSSNSSGTGSGSHVDIHIHAILTPVRINGGQDPPNSRDELENSTNESEQPSTSENLMSSLFAPLLPSHAQSESSTPPPDQNTFEESDFNSLQPDSLEIQSPAEKDLDLKQSTVSETHHDEEYDYHHHHHPMAAHTESDSSLHSDRNLKKMKTRSPTRVSENTSDWRSIGKSRERPSSMKKKTETSIPPRSASNQSDSDTSNLSMTMTSSSSNAAASAVPFSSSSDQRNTNSLSTRREMRGLMKAIDTASSSSSSSSSPSSSIPSTATSELYRERKDARLSAEKSELSLKSSPKKSSSTQKLESHNSSSSSSSLKRTETSESTSRRNLSLPVPQSVPLDESAIPESQQIQSRQASAETSFIQRVRRSLSFRQPQQKQNPKQP